METVARLIGGGVVAVLEVEYLPSVSIDTLKKMYQNRIDEARRFAGDSPDFPVNFGTYALKPKITKMYFMAYVQPGLPGERVTMLYAGQITELQKVMEEINGWSCKWAELSEIHQ
jgi:hypothetical protein